MIDLINLIPRNTSFEFWFLVGCCMLALWFFFRQSFQLKALQSKLTKVQSLILEEGYKLSKEIEQNSKVNLQLIYDRLNQNHLLIQQVTTEIIQRQMQDIREQITHSFKQHATSLTSHLQTLTEEIHRHLQGLSQQVNTQLTAGFEKTSSTFIDIVRRLAIIDEAQKKITELSSHVVSLQDILIDKRARGVFGEVQLSALIANILPSTHYRMQHVLSNQKRADCILFLPEPTGNVVIDAKFPLETYQKLMNTALEQKKPLQQQFRQDVQKHIKDIAAKYIIPNETTDGALMFIPAEAIFAEIHANYPEVISLSQRLKVWLVSPSTLMAVLTTAKAVLKDDETKKHVHIIQQHLQALAEDFQRFEKRMDKLSKHIDLAHQDAMEVNTSAKKITQRFQKIDAVELRQVNEMAAIE